MNKKWFAVTVALVLAVGFVSCQEKIPDYLIVDGTTLTGYTDDVPANLVIPKSITKIAGGAFVGRDWLESVTIPGSVKTIGEDITLEEAEEKGMDGKGVFYRCQSLRDVTIEKGVKVIGTRSFAMCDRLTNVTIPHGVTTIGRCAFYGCKSLESVTIPDSVTEIGDGAFYGCESLASVTIPNSVKTIGEYAFSKCYTLTSVTIPNSVKTIGRGAFYDCENIAVVTYKGALKDWCVVDWYASLISSAKRIALSDGTDLRKLSEITANDLAGVKTIGLLAFVGCKSLTSVTIPNSVTKIGDGAFGDCESLTSLTIPSSVTEIGAWAFEGCDSLTSVQYGGTKAEWGKIAIDVLSGLSGKKITGKDGSTWTAE